LPLRLLYSSALSSRRVTFLLCGCRRFCLFCSADSASINFIPRDSPFSVSVFFWSTYGRTQRRQPVFFTEPWVVYGSLPLKTLFFVLRKTPPRFARAPLPCLVFLVPLPFAEEGFYCSPCGRFRVSPHANSSPVPPYAVLISGGPILGATPPRRLENRFTSGLSLLSKRKWSLSRVQSLVCLVL